MAVTPGWGAGQRLLRLVGYAKAMEFLLTGTILRADDLLHLRLANEVTDAGQALTRALDFAKKIASEPPEVVRGIKVLLQAGLTSPYEEALRRERELFPPLWAGEAHQKAVQAFFDRQNQKREGTE